MTPVTVIVHDVPVHVTYAQAQFLVEVGAIKPVALNALCST